MNLIPNKQFAEHLDADIKARVASLQKIEQPGFPDSIYQNLPRFLSFPCREILRERTEREVFLIGALGVISGCLPNVTGFYDGKHIHPNLYAYILAPYGSGKGALTYARQIGEQIHSMRREEYKMLEAEYKRKKRAFADNPVGDEPEKPSNSMLFLPANVSKTGLQELLSGNDSKGILFETEGDTLADALDQKHGHFGDVLNKSFHHEPVTYYRRTEREYSDIEKPCLSVVLSSTFDQYLKLIPTAQNGLFSRFLHYNMEPNREFRNVFDKDKKRYPEYFQSMSVEMLRYYERLEGQIAGINFELSTSQQDEFLAVFSRWKSELGNMSDLDGTVNRLGLIAFRIAMILTVLRSFSESGGPAEYIMCDTTDFDNALAIIDVMKHHAIAVYQSLPKVNSNVLKQPNQIAKQFSDRAAQVNLAVELRGKNHSLAQIAKEVLGDESKKSLIHSWLKKHDQKID